MEHGKPRETFIVFELDRAYGLWCEVFKAQLNRRGRRYLAKNLELVEKKGWKKPYRIRINRELPTDI